ncbi:37S ribosomal protein mrp4, mitochondrial [Saitozyma sp. JCM 24511]|nr:37S ribosomal protein mrp4, mitochondrial [Saitozyma sp. JCM 24511]
MRGTATAAVAAAARGAQVASRPAVPRAVRAFASSSCSRDASTEAESSTTSAARPGRGASHPGESAEQAFARNLKEVQAFRRRKEQQREWARTTTDRLYMIMMAVTSAVTCNGAVNVLRESTPLFLPPSASPPPSRTPLQTTLSTLLASGAALGHSTTLLHPSYTPYIYGNRSGLSIIDLDQTLPILRRAAALVRDVVRADGVVLVVGTRQGLKKALDKAKERLGTNGYVTASWLPGTLTNAETFFGIEPIADKSYLPDLVVFLNPSENLGAIRECTSKNIPTVGIVDTDTDPRIVTYPIPANMESIRTSELILGTLSIAGQEGRRLRVKEQAEKSKAQNQARKRRN